MPANGVLNDVPPIVFDVVAPVPVRLSVAAPSPTLVGVGSTLQLTTLAIYQDGAPMDVSTLAAGTNYTSSNPAIASIDPNGLVTARASGTVLLTALNDGATGLLQLSVLISADTDGDGIPDDYEIAHGLNPNDPTDALEDPDHDGLTNLQEYQRGTDPHNPDTDGDGLPDGLEVKLGTNPLAYDTDGGGVGDGLEAQAGTNPLDPSDDKNALGLGVASLEVRPGALVVYMNTLLGEGSGQLQVTGHLIDGHTLDLTSKARGTNYSSSDLTIASFGAVDGQVFGGRGGSATVTVSNSGHSVLVPVAVNAFSPTALSYVSIPGYANDVDVAGGFAYVAAGGAGLQVVDVSDRAQPQVVAALPVGNAADVKVAGGVAYVAAEGSGLKAVDVGNPGAPAVLGSVAIAGGAQDLVVRGGLAYVGGPSGLFIVDISNPRAPLVLGSYATAGAVRGVDVSGTVAVLAGAVLAGQAEGILTLDVSDPSQPAFLGSLATVSAQGVAFDGNTAYVADYTGSLATVDITSAAAPRLLARTTGTLGGYLLDVAKRGDFTFGADVFFVNGVPITNVVDPSNPQVAARLDFPARDDNGIGIAVDNQFVYLVTSHTGGSRPGVASGDSRLYIGQYLQITDTAGIPPQVTITQPSPGSDVVAGRTVGVHADATDDMGVASVVFSVNGVPAFTAFSAPYDFSYKVPLDATSLTFDATAIDFGNNSGQANPVTITVHPDAPPAVSLTSPDLSARPLERTPITLAATASDVDGRITKVQFAVNGSVVATRLTPPYQASYVVPTGIPSLHIVARAFDDVGQSTDAARDIPVSINPAPPAPDASLIVADAPVGGLSAVTGQAGAMSRATSLEATNAANNAQVTVSAATDGSFALSIAASPDDLLSLVSINSDGLRSPPTIVPVRRTPQVPPATGSTSLHFEGLAVDRVGTTSLTPDGALDAVFTVTASIGTGVTRQLSAIDLVGPLTRSTRSGVGGPLGVSLDAGSPLLNGGSGQVGGAFTSNVSFTLFAADAGFVQPGATYTVTLAFVDGSRFVAAFTIVASQDKSYVSHSMRITTSLASVVVSPGAAGTTILTLSDIRDIDGTRVPDGAQVGIAVADMASKDPRGSVIRSAGGAILDGTPAVNNPAFQVFGIANGRVTATYSSGAVSPGPVLGSLAVVQVQAVDAGGNVLGTEAAATLDLNLRATADQAIIEVGRSSLYADKADRRSHLQIQVRTGTGDPAADGTVVAVTASYNGAYFNGWLGSAGGQILGGAASPSTSPYGAPYRALTVSNGMVECDYSDAGVAVGVGQTATALVTVLPADSSGTVTSFTPLGTAAITLTGAASSEVELSGGSVPLSFPTRPIGILAHHVHDTRANLVPDGANVLLSVDNNATYLNGWIGSAGGTIVDGTLSASTSPYGARYRFFPLSLGQVLTTYTVNPGMGAAPGEVRNALIQEAMGDPSGDLLDYTPITLTTLRVVAPTNAVGTAQPPTVFADGGLHTSAVTFGPVIDSYGNPLPDGSLVLASAGNNAAYLNGWIGSAGGQILNGTPSVSTSPYGATYKALAVQGGFVTVSYGDQNVAHGPGDQQPASVVLLESSSSGEILAGNYVPLGVVTVPSAGLTTATASLSAPRVHADGGDRRTTITLSALKDAAGQPVPEGTLVAVSAADNAAYQNGWIGSAGGTIVAGTVGSFTSPYGAPYKVFPVQSGQVVFEYSNLGAPVATGSQTANVVALTVTPSGGFISWTPVVTAPVLLVAPGSAVATATPSSMLADGAPHLSQVRFASPTESDGTPVPDGALVLLSADNNAAYSSGWIGSAGGQIVDGTFSSSTSPYGARYKIVTAQGSAVEAAYSEEGIAAQAGETKSVKVVALGSSSSGTVIANNYTPFALTTINLQGITSAVGNGPTTVSLGSSGTITFSGIKDAAGNTVPDGTNVLVSAENNAAYQNGWIGSAGGTIVEGAVSSSTSPYGARYKIATVIGGGVTLTYSTQGASVGTAHVVVLPGNPVGEKIGDIPLAGGDWTITVTN